MRYMVSDLDQQKEVIGASQSNDRPVVQFLSDLIDSNKKGNICVKVLVVSESLRSKSGWQYRKMQIADGTLSSDMLISESKFSEWNFHTGDYLICNAKSNGLDNEGKLSLFFNDFLGPFETARMLFEANQALYETRFKASGKMKSSETVYQISAREARSLMELIRLWIREGKPQHYTKWCQMHQIVATNLFYMGLVKRTASMSGYYYPTQEALEFFAGKRNFPKKKVFVKGGDGKHILVSEDEETRSFAEFLQDYADRDKALEDYREALTSNLDKIKAILERDA